MVNRIEQEIVVKVIGGKDVGALEKQIKELSRSKAELLVDADTDEARDELDKIEAQLVELRDEKAQIVVDAKVDRAISALDEVALEAKKTEAAAEALSIALGPELAAKADVDGIIADFRRMDLSFNDIIANADKLGAKLREVGNQDVSGRITTGFSRVGTEARSAGGSTSVLANAIGNTAQDIGEAAGLAGTAGVAIGQMGEYMADAVLSGDKLTTALGNFAKIAGPVAFLTAAVSVFNGIMKENQARAKATKKSIEELGEAMAESGDDALGFAEHFRNNTGALEEFNTAAEGFGEHFVENLAAVGRNLPLIGGLVGDAGQGLKDLLPIFAQLNVSMYDFGKAIDTDEGMVEFFNETLLQAKVTGQITEGQYDAMTQALLKYRDQVIAADKVQELWNVDQEEANALFQEFLNQRNPLRQWRAEWQTLMEDMRDGRVDTAEAADAINFLAEKLGKDPGEIWSIAMGEIERKSDEASDALKENQKAAEEWAKAQQDAADDAADAMGDALIAIDDMASSFSTMERNEDAISKAFDLGNAPLEALEAVTDINDAIRDLGQFIEDNEGVVPNIFDPNDVDAGPFLAKISSLRSPIQEAVQGAFATGGPVAARATADAYVRQIVDSMHGLLTPAQVATLLGLGDLEATLKIAVDQASLATATQMLEILTGLQGETPWTATVQLALAAGTITPDAARVLIAGRLEELGVPVPTQLEEPTEGSATAAVAAAQRFMADNPLDMTANVNDPSLQALIDARNAGQDDADGMPIVFPSTVAAPEIPWWVPHDAGGRVGAAGGIAGERGPEIIDDRWLTTGTTYVPPGTKVTSRRRTAVILRQHRRDLPRYDAGGIVPMGPVTVNLNGVGAVGNRYDLMRIIDRGIRDSKRLRGTRA